MSFRINEINVKKTGDKNKTPTPSILKKEIVLFGNSFSNKVKEDFYTELGVLLKAGVSLKESLTLLKNAQKKKINKETLENVIHQIIEGKGFSEAIREANHFSEYEYYSLKIGEETGTLAKVSEQLSEYYSRKNEQRRNIINSLTYPIIILSTAILVVIFMLQFVVPMFQDIFEQQNVELPFITQFIVDVSEKLQKFGWLFLLATILFFIGCIILNKKIWFRKAKGKALVKIPFLGDFYKTVYLSQFTQAVSLLMSSKVPMVHSIQLVKKMINFYPLQKALSQVEKDLLRGESLSKSLKGHHIFDEKMIALVKVAEETNQNEFIFERLNHQYNTQMQQKSKLLSTIMEPFIILFVGILVGVILIAMYLPMFKLSSVLG